PPPNARRAPGDPGRSSISRLLIRAPTWPPTPPTATRARDGIAGDELTVGAVACKPVPLPTIAQRRAGQAPPHENPPPPPPSARSTASVSMSALNALARHASTAASKAATGTRTLFAQASRTDFKKVAQPTTRALPAPRLWVSSARPHSAQARKPPRRYGLCR